MKTIFLFLFISSILLFSCKKPETEYKLSGIAVSEANLGECFKKNYGLSKEVISDDSTYQLLRTKLLDSKAECQNAQLNPIDFSKYTLLGNDLCTGGEECTKYIETKVTIDDNNMQYICTITIKGRFCLKFNKKCIDVMLWILVPKLPSGYTVKFIAERI